MKPVRTVSEEFKYVKPYPWKGTGEYRVVQRRKVRLIFEVQRTCDCGRCGRRYDRHSHRRLAWPWKKTWDEEFFPTFPE